MSKVFVVVVNYHSWDKIKRLKAPNLIVVDNDKNNLGFAAGVNQGIKKALKFDATHVLLVNPDVVITESDIQKLLRINGDIVSPILKFQRKGKWIYDHGGRVNFILGRTTHIETTSNQQPATSDQIDYVSGACMLIKRRVFEEISFFDERFFLYFEDVDFCLRAKRAGFKVLVNPKVLVQHDIDEQRYSHDRFKIQQNLKSNLFFIHKWIPWYFQPVAHIYLLLLAALKLFSMSEPLLEPLLRKLRFNKALACISANSMVVDIGCGHTPHLLNRLERYIESGIGVDQLIADKKVGKIKLISRLLADKIPLRSDLADHVTLIAVLEHLEMPGPLLKEAYRILKKGGTLILTTPTPLNKPLLEFLSFRLGLVSRREIAEHKTYFWKKELIHLVEVAGFKNIRHQYFEMYLNNFLLAEK